MGQAQGLARQLGEIVEVARVGRGDGEERRLRRCLRPRVDPGGGEIEEGAEIRRGGRILGPGEPRLAHQTDEWCSMGRIDQSVEIFRTLAQRWWGA